MKRRSVEELRDDVKDAAQRLIDIASASSWLTESGHRSTQSLVKFERLVVLLPTSVRRPNPVRTDPHIGAVELPSQVLALARSPQKNEGREAATGNPSLPPSRPSRTFSRSALACLSPSRTSPDKDRWRRPPTDRSHPTGSPRRRGSRAHTPSPTSSRRPVRRPCRWGSWRPKCSLTASCWPRRFPGTDRSNTGLGCSARRRRSRLRRGSQPHISQGRSTQCQAHKQFLWGNSRPRCNPPLGPPRTRQDKDRSNSRAGCSARRNHNRQRHGIQGRRWRAPSSPSPARKPCRGDSSRRTYTGAALGLAHTFLGKDRSSIGLGCIFRWRRNPPPSGSRARRRPGSGSPSRAHTPCHPHSPCRRCSPSPCRARKHPGKDT